MTKNVILVLLVLSAYVGLFGQYGWTLNMFEPEIIDARAEALGRTSILSSSGANFIFNNPAMLSNLSQKNVQFSGRSVFGKNERKHEYNEETDKTEHEYPLHVKFNGFAFGMPYNMSENDNLKLGFGVGFRTYYDLGFNIHYESDEEDDNYEWDKKFHGGFSTLVLGGGFNYQEKFFGGISFSFPFLSNISSETKYSDGYNEDYETEGTMTGSFFTLSGSYILNENITIGARLRTGFELEWETEYEEEPDWENEITIPSEFGLAIEMKPNINLRFYAEYLTRNFGDFEIENYYFDQDLYDDSNNGYSLRTGFEVGTNNVFRGGFFIQSVPIYEMESYYNENWEEYEVRMDDKPQTEIGFTTGFGVKINPNLSLDVFGAYSFLNYDESYVYYYDDEQVLNEYSFYKIKIGCSMGYSF